MKKALRISFVNSGFGSGVSAGVGYSFLPFKDKSKSLDACLTRASTFSPPRREDTEVAQGQSEKLREKGFYHLLIAHSSLILLDLSCPSM